MEQWSSYRFEDFVLFSGRVYLRMLEAYNQQWWEWQLTVGPIFLALLVYSHKRSVGWILLGFVAISWVGSGYLFFQGAYLSINWAAEYFAYGFYVQAALLAGVGIHQRFMETKTTTVSHPGYLEFFVGLIFVGYPCVLWLSGRPFWAYEAIAFHPDPTVLITMAYILKLPARWNLLILMPIPVFWCLISWATLDTLNVPGIAASFGISLLLVLLLVAKFVRTSKNGGFPQQQ